MKGVEELVGDPLKKQLMSFIDDKKEELVSFLQELVRIPSDNPPGDCERISSHIYDRMQSFGFSDVSIHEIPKEELLKVGMKKAANVLAYERFDGDGLEITLNSHGDVVPPGAGWTANPYGGEIIAGKLYGRGAAVSKSDIATYTFAALALREMAHGLKGKISLAFTFDEETGGEIGPKWLLEKSLIKPDYAVCPGFSYSIVNAHNGCLHLEVKTKGKQAHAAEPQFGHDALESMTGVLQALYEYRKTLGLVKSNVPGIESPTLVIGKIIGGINTNVVPDECIIRLDRRLIPEESPEEVEQELSSIILAAGAKCEGIEVEINRILLAESFGPVPVESPLVQAFRSNWKEVMKGELPVQGSPLYTDARHFYEAGIPVILFGAGPRTLLEANGHRADEHILIDDLVKATKVVALSLFELLKKER
jgi:succinyl-diaminopimelate desuccinylase